MHLDLQSYGFTTEHQQAFDTTFRYAERELHPLLPCMDDEDWFPEEAFRKMSEVGLLGLTIPTEYGGAGMDLCSQFFAAEAVSYWNNSIAASWLASDNLCAHNILRNADEAQRRRYLPRLCDGSAIGALGLTEPGAGSDALGAMRTTARRDEDCFRLNGRKMFITNGPVADLLLVYAKTSPERGAHGISAFIVEKSFEGFSVAQKLDKMGWRGSPTGELVFDECRVPVENLVFGENRGVAVVMSGLDIERVMLCAYGLGLSQRAFDLALGYAREREQFGARIADFQMVQAMLADMYTDLETMRALSYQLLREVADLEVGGGGRGPTHMRSACAYLHAGRATMRILDQAVQIYGGMGFMRESEVNRLYRSGKVLEIGGGTNQIRQRIVAEELIK